VGRPNRAPDRESRLFAKQGVQKERAADKVGTPEAFHPITHVLAKLLQVSLYLLQLCKFSPILKVIILMLERQSNLVNFLYLGSRLPAGANGLYLQINKITSLPPTTQCLITLSTAQYFVETCKRHNEHCNWK